MKINKLWTVIKLMRPQSVVLMCLFLSIPIARAYNSIFSALIEVLPFFLLLCGEIGLNDICDLSKDRINKPHRPLVSGVISIKTAICATLLVLLTGVLSGIIIYHNNSARLTIFLSVFLLLTCYNFPGKLMPLIKAQITAISTVISLSFVMTYTHITHPILKLLAAFFFIMGRELMMDIRDYDGDYENHYITFVIKIGKQRALFVSTLFFIFSIFICSIYVLLDGSAFDLLALELYSMCTIALIFAYRSAIGQKNQNKIILLFWLPILTMLITFI